MLPAASPAVAQTDTVCLTMVEFTNLLDTVDVQDVENDRLTTNLINCQKEKAPDEEGFPWTECLVSFAAGVVVMGLLQ